MDTVFRFIFDLIFSILKPALKLSFWAARFVFKLKLKLLKYLMRFLNWMDADSYIFAAIFFALGLHFNRHKFDKKS